MRRQQLIALAGGVVAGVVLIGSMVVAGLAYRAAREAEEVARRASERVSPPSPDWRQTTWHRGAVEA